MFFVFVFVFVFDKTYLTPALTPGPSLQSVKKLFSASLLFSKQNRPLFDSWHNHDFHINTFIHFIHVVKEMHKTSRKYLKKNSIKNIFSIPLYQFQSKLSIMGLRNVILVCNTLSMMCLLVTGLK